MKMPTVEVSALVSIKLVYLKMQLAETWHGV